MAYYFSQGNCPFQQSRDIFSDSIRAKLLCAETLWRQDVTGRSLDSSGPERRALTRVLSLFFHSFRFLAPPIDPLKDHSFGHIPVDEWPYGALFQLQCPTIMGNQPKASEHFQRYVLQTDIASRIASDLMVVFPGLAARNESSMNTLGRSNCAV